MFSNGPYSFPLDLFVLVFFLIGLSVYIFSSCSVVLFGGSVYLYLLLLFFSSRFICAYSFSAVSCVLVGRILFWWVHLCLCLLRWVCVSVFSLVTPLFFPVDLFLPANGSVPFTTDPLFFPIGL